MTIYILFYAGAYSNNDERNVLKVSLKVDDFLADINKYYQNIYGEGEIETVTMERIAKKEIAKFKNTKTWRVYIDDRFTIERHIIK